MGELGLMAIGALGQGGRGEEIMSAAGAGTLFGMASFWIRHGIRFPSRFRAQGLERVPALIGQGRTAAGAGIQIGTAAGAQTATFRATEGLHGQGEKHLFAGNISGVHPGAGKESDFGVGGMNFGFAALANDRFGLVKEIEITLHHHGDGFEAASTGGRHLRPEMAMQAHAFTGQTSFAGEGEFAGNLGHGSQLGRTEAKGKLHRVQPQILDFNMQVASAAADHRGVVGAIGLEPMTSAV